MILIPTTRTYTPRPLTPAERRAAFYARLQVEVIPVYPFPHVKARQYATEQMRDHPTDYSADYGDLSHGV